MTLTLLFHKPHVIVTIRKTDLAKDAADARPEVFSKDNALDAKITELDLKNRKVKFAELSVVATAVAFLSSDASILFTGTSIFVDCCLGPPGRGRLLDDVLRGYPFIFRKALRELEGVY